jgi:hypothetical protein
VYVLPAGASGGTLTHVGSVGVALVTAGDVTPDGGAAVIRTYGSVLVFRRPPGTPLASAFLSAPCTGASVPEPQGEAIAAAPDGNGYATVSEGNHPPIHFFSR